MEEFLIKNNIPEDIRQNFQSNGITFNDFYKLNDELLKELCPHIGTRIKLREIITAYAPTESTSERETDKNQSDHPSLNDQENIPPSLDGVVPPFNEAYSVPPDEDCGTHIILTRIFPDFDLKTLLQTSPGGNSIIQYYKTFKSLNNNKRNQLTDIVIKHMYTYIVNNRITYQDYNIIAAKIVTLFPKECTGTYFTKPVKKSDSVTGRPVVARGKLVDKVRNLLFKYGERKRKSNETDDNNESFMKKSRTAIFEGELNEDVLWLKANTEPWDDVITKWKNTFHIRKESGKLENVHDFYITWPILYEIKSEQLINIDFELLYPDKSLNFYLNWNTFFEKFISLKKTKDEQILNLLKTLQELDEELRIPGQIKAMIQLLPPKGRLNKKVKFSTQEAIDSIFICTPISGDISNIVAEQKSKALSKKLPVQPYIILQGTLHHCTTPLLVIDDIKYKFNSISKAFDTLFKAFHVFHAQYPKASEHIHLIIQRCVYGVETKYDNVVPYIADVLNQC